MSRELIFLLSKLTVLIFCLPVHECAHAWMANRLGDPTAKNEGRLTLNPLKHLDPWGAALLFAGGIGYAKSVPVRARNFKNRKRDLALTAFAGPVANVLTSVLLLVVVRVIQTIPGMGQILKTALTILKSAARINIGLAVFNMIPLPPLDGYRVLSGFLPDNNIFTKLNGNARLAILIGLILLSRGGYLPTSKLSAAIYRVLYRIIVTG